MHLRKIWLPGEIFLKHTHETWWFMWRKRSNSQFQMANHRDWGIMGYNDVIVCVTVIKSDECLLFRGSGLISSDKSDGSDCWLWTQPFAAAAELVLDSEFIVNSVLIFSSMLLTLRYVDSQLYDCTRVKLTQKIFGRWRVHETDHVRQFVNALYTVSLIDDFIANIFSQRGCLWKNC